MSAWPKREDFNSAAEHLAAVHEQDRKERERELIERQQRIAAEAIPPRFRDCTWSTYPADNDEAKRTLEAVRKYVARFAENPGYNLGLLGKTGTGKTMLLALALRSLIETGRRGEYTTESELVQRVRSSYGTGDTDQLYYHLKQLDVLVLDELGKGDGDPAKRADILFKVLDSRYQAGRATLFAANMPVRGDEKRPGLVQLLGDATVRRLTERALIKSLNWRAFHA